MLILTYIKLWALYLMQDSIVFHPKISGLKPIQDPAFYDFKDTTDETIITEDGVKIHYWIKKPSDPSKPFVVFFHGNAGHFGDLKSLTEKNNERGYRLHLLHNFVDSGYGFIAVSLRGYGNLVIIKHDNTYLTAYAHNRSLLVKEGDTVKKGQKIAEMGDTDTNSVKLHFELRVNGKPVNPTPYLQ